MPRRDVHVNDYERTREGRSERVRDYTQLRESAVEERPGHAALRRRRSVPIPERNPDFDLDLYRWQDDMVERDAKRMENRRLGYVLEGSGDIFRELTGRTYADDNYIDEKVERIRRSLDDPAEVRSMDVAPSLGDYEIQRRMEHNWLSLPEYQLSPRLSAVRMLNVALASRDFEGARRWINAVQELRGKT